MKKNLVVFDLDGTLLDTVGDLACAGNAMLAKRGFDAYTPEQYRFFVGNGVTRLVERILPEHLRTPEYVADARRDFVDFYVEHIDRYTRPYEGVAELLDALSAAGCRLAVASNKFHAGTCKLVEKFFPAIKFSSVYGNRDGVPLKPDAELLRLIMAECDSAPSRCCMVGDSGIDIVTARNASARSIGVTWGFRPRGELIENGADAIADTPAQVSDFLKEFGIV